MKKLLTVVFAMLLAASLSFAQAGGDKDTKKDDKTAADKGDKKDKKKKDKKDKKKGDKNKKGSGDAGTPPPK